MNSQCERVLFREIKHTRLKGSSHRRTLHGIDAEARFRSGTHVEPLRNEGAATIARAAEDCCAPSVLRCVQVPTHGHANMAEPARRRIHCAGWLRPVPEPTAREPWPALAHVWMMHRVRVKLCTRVLRACGRAVGIKRRRAARPSRAALGHAVHVLCARSAAAARAPTASSLSCRPRSGHMCRCARWRTRRACSA